VLALLIESEHENSSGESISGETRRMTSRRAKRKKALPFEEVGLDGVDHLGEFA
jgi:hypothetical protein